jgi:hypothetical protein
MRDGYGNALGGIRTPYVDVPVATLSGEGNAGGPNNGVFCGLFGRTQLFSKVQLSKLYSNNAGFASKVSTSLNQTLQNGFLLQPDVAVIEQWAKSFKIGN